MQFDSREIEQFLYHEAELLDARQYKEWLELFTDDAIYWMPTGGEKSDSNILSKHNINNYNMICSEKHF